MKLLPSRITPGAPAQACHTRSSCPVMYLLLLSPSHVTPGSLAESCHPCKSCWRISKFQRRIVFAQSCHSWCSCRRTSKFQRRIVFAQSCHSWIFAQSCHSWSSCPVMSLLVLLSVVSLLELLPANFWFPAAYCFRISPASVEKKTCWFTKRKKTLSNNTYCTFLCM